MNSGIACVVKSTIPRTRRTKPMRKGLKPSQKWWTGKSKKKKIIG